MGTAGRDDGGGLRLALLGVPITVRLSVVLVLAVLGYGGDLTGVVLFVAIGLVSITLHELGHALVARRAGAEPHVELAGFGGVTRYMPTARSRTRPWALAIGLAGPAVGIAVGIAAIIVRDATGPYAGVAAQAWQVLVFTSIGWSVLNLLPIPPLDGGQAMIQLLPGDERTRHRRGAAVGVVTAGLLVVVGLYFGQTFAALFGGLFALQNWQTMQALRGPEPQPAGDVPAPPTVQQQADATRDWFAAGNGSLEQLAEVQQRAEAEGMHQLAAQLGEVALRRGATDPDFAVRTARAWHALAVGNRAAQALEAAVRLGADPTALAADPTLPAS